MCLTEVLYWYLPPKPGSPGGNFPRHILPSYCHNSQSFLAPKLGCTATSAIVPGFRGTPRCASPVKYYLVTTSLQQAALGEAGLITFTGQGNDMGTAYMTGSFPILGNFRAR